MDQIGTGQKVVIVEDNAALADVYKTRLELLGYNCIVANDGIDAVSIIRRELPALVLLDLMVPKIAGDQILEIMRGSDWGKNIKVLVVSNLNEADAPAGLRDKGIEGYAVKANLSDDALDKLVDSILKPADQTESTDLESEAPTAVTLPVPPSPVVASPSVQPTDPLSGSAADPAAFASALHADPMSPAATPTQPDPFTSPAPSADSSASTVPPDNMSYQEAQPANPPTPAADISPQEPHYG